MVTCYVSLRTWIHSAHLHRSPAHEEGTLLSPSLDSERLRLRKVQRLVQSFPVPWPLAVIGRYAKMWGIGWMGEGEGAMGGEPPGGRHTLQPLTPIIRSPGAPWEMPPSDLGQRNNMKATLFLPPRSQLCRDRAACGQSLQTTQLGTLGALGLWETFFHTFSKIFLMLFLGFCLFVCLIGK